MGSEKGDNIAFAALQGSGTREVAPKKTRTRSGCLNCRRRRRKCDELRPSCLNCRQRGEECEWGIKVTFRPDNASALGAEHPSMREGSRKRPRHFKIMDITSQVEKDHNLHTSLDVESPTSSRQDEPQSAISPPPRINAGFESINNPQRRFSQSIQRSSDDSPSAWQAETPSFYTPNSMDASHSDGVLLSADGDSQTSPISNTSHLNLIESHHSHHSEYSDRPGPTLFGSESRRRLSNNITERSPIHTEDAAAELLALRYMPAHLSQRPDSMNTASSITEPAEIQLPIFHDSIEERSTLDHQMFDDVDGIFLPGSAYQELHSTLRDHLIYTARSNAPTRDGTPEAQPDMGFFSRGPPKDSESTEETRESDPESIHSSKPSEISPQREYVLWKTWIDEVAPWLDKFDNGRMFEHKLPMIAKTTPHLRSSILALCARQIERKENSKSSSESLALYQEAIHLLLPELQSKNTAVIASCVILCVLEMMSCAPKEWRRHLEGCANLLEAVGINGFVGGVEEALFWCFARMDICGALISQDLTIIPVQRWASNIDLTEDIRLFRNPTRGFDSYANYAVMLCAHCVTYLGHEPGTRRSEARWSELFGHLEDWYSQRPEEMKPILTIPAAEGKDSSPFPTVLYGNGPAVSGNQLYHTATLLMLQEKPSSIKLQNKQKSIFWHARQICAISESNTHHGAWTNSIQPIWIAGKVMSHPSEHRAILGIYERIERETGWATGWRREDLKNWWGDSDE